MMHEDLSLYERAIAMDDYATWSSRDRQDPRATPMQVADWLVALEDEAGIEDEAADQAKQLMSMFNG